MSREETSLGKKLLVGLGTTAVSTTALVGAGIAYSFWGVDHDQSLPLAVDADLAYFESDRAGKLAYYANRSGTGRPLLLIHSINAAASAFEMKPLFDAYAGKRPVFALELPGFGFSDRSNRTYSPKLYREAILDFARDIVGDPSDMIALSLGCEFAAAAALEVPERFTSLTLLSPTGLGAFEFETPGDALHAVFSFPLWGQPLFDLIASRPSINYFLGKSFVGDTPKELIDYSYATAHRPGARYAPLYFLSGQLFTGNIRSAVYERLTTPTLIIYDKDANVSFDKLPTLLEMNGDITAVRVSPTMGLPHWEQTAETMLALEQFWG